MRQFAVLTITFNYDLHGLVGVEFNGSEGTCHRTIEEDPAEASLKSVTLVHIPHALYYSTAHILGRAQLLHDTQSLEWVREGTTEACAHKASDHMRQLSGLYDSGVGRRSLLDTCGHQKC